MAVSGSYTYTGQAQIPAADAVTVQLDGKIIPNDQYTIAVSDNTNAGQATVTVTGKDDYIGTASGTFTIGKATPNPTTPTELNAVYGSTLKDVPLPKGWAWDTPDSSVGNVGEKTFAATYSKDNSGNYTWNGCDQKGRRVASGIYMVKTSKNIIPQMPISMRL